MDTSPGLSATCLGCGCTCDDIRIVTDAGRIVEAHRACPLGVAWFGDGVVPARLIVEGREAGLDEAIAAIAGLLSGTARPLVYLAPDVSCETQREATGLADLLRASIDSLTSATALPFVLAAQERGRASATLGEIRNRADVLVWWGVDPAARYPRYSSRYAPEPAGVHVPLGRRSRLVVAVDVGGSRGPSDADRRMAVPAAREASVLTALAARLLRDDERAGPEVPASDPTDVTGPVVTATATTVTAMDDSQEPGTLPEPPSVLESADPMEVADTLAGWLLAGRYVVLIADASADGAEGRSGGLIAVAQALNGPTRGALSLLGTGGNAAGADAVLTWQTGYPAAVDFARGVPRYRPHDGTAEARLARGEVEALLVIGSADAIPPRLVERMARVPHAVVGPRASASPLANGRAVVDTAVAGIHEAGLAVRMDEVPLPLRQVLEGPPAAAAVVRALRDRCRLVGAGPV